MLTDTKLRALKPRVRPYRIADSHGLCIEVRPTGTKAWRYRYRYAGKPYKSPRCFWPSTMAWCAAPSTASPGAFTPSRSR